MVIYGFWGHDIKRINLGFNAKMSIAFLSSAYCLRFSKAITKILFKSNYYYAIRGNKTHYNRIAKVIYAHALGYYAYPFVITFNKAKGIELMERGQVVNVNYNDSLISTYNNIWSIRGLIKRTAIYNGLWFMIFL